LKKPFKAIKKTDIRNETAILGSNVYAQMKCRVYITTSVSYFKYLDDIQA